MCIRDSSLSRLIRALPLVRTVTGDRAVLRAVHFFQENERVARERDCLQQNDLTGFLTLMNESGDSSWELLQNCSLPDRPTRQGIKLALALSRILCEGTGAARVHGGGFAGTVQCLVPRKKSVFFRKGMEAVFGRQSVIPIRLSPVGAIEIM